jgi:hypothetical protein
MRIDPDEIGRRTDFRHEQAEGAGPAPGLGIVEREFARVDAHEYFRAIAGDGRHRIF